MLSYLRSNNRRSALPPPSTPYTASTRQIHSLQGSTEDFSHNHAYRTAYQPSPSPISPDPPVLPPIPRVASRYDSGKKHAGDTQTTQEEITCAEEPSSEQYDKTSTYEDRLTTSIKNEQQPATSRSAVVGSPPIPLHQNSQSQNRQLRPPNAVSDSTRSYSEPFAKHTRGMRQDQMDEESNSARAPPPSPLKLSTSPGAGTAQGRQGKTKFNLLNPMALLARRRSHQAIAEANSEKSQYKHAFPPVPGIPDDFDPRIRGKVVHDFSAPRPGSNMDSTRVRDADRQRAAILYHSRKPSPNPSPNPTTSSADDDSPTSGERDHTPQFKEHFDDDSWALQDGPAKKGTSAFMYHVSLSESQPDPDRSVLPPFARHLPSKIISAPIPAQTNSSPSPSLRKSLEIVPEICVSDAVSLDRSLPSTPPKSPPVKPRSRASSNADTPYQPAALPKRFKSNASRFSFDMTGVGSASQEQILEEKHRENERKKARRGNDSQHSTVSTCMRDADDFDECSDEYDEVEDDDGFEERIPGVNTDADEAILLDAHHHTQDVDFISPNKSSFTSNPSLASINITSPNTPRDGMGRSGDLVMNEASPNFIQAHNFNEFPCVKSVEFKDWKERHDHAAHAHPAMGFKAGMNAPRPSLQQNDEDDMYFDDGIIDDLDGQEGHVFDESVFDDDTSRVYGPPLRELKPLSEETATTSELAHGDPTDNTDRGVVALAADSRLSSNSFTGAADGFVPNNQDTRTSFSQTTTMSDHTSYHDALIAGVNEAALKGKFVRYTGLGLEAQISFGDNVGNFPVGMPMNGIDGRQANGLHLGGGIEDAEDFDFDDALADDPIIAAANAEALENDDEGFYGQEFGFFARASGAGEAQYANGGYFGSRGIEGIGRSHSGRVNEPSLTPITERSEWSNRNSAISLAMHGFPPHSAGPQPSPGLAQLADMMHFEDDDMSLSTLMKLRRGAWGGSSASLQSSSSGSPLNYVPGVGFPAAIPMQHSNSSNSNANLPNSSPLTMHSGHNFSSSSYSLNSSNGFASSHEDSSPSPASATVTFSTQQQALPTQQPPQSAPVLFPRQQQLQQTTPILSPPVVNLSQQPQRRSMSPVKRSSIGLPPKPVSGHSRNNSGASESVSYMLEPGGEDGRQGRWVLEKRRIDESGVVEVLGREIVEGGRI
ncbi:MAG: hypothetical protein Q9201_006359 [Fulgogasparrea decipioides]